MSANQFIQPEGSYDSQGNQMMHIMSNYQDQHLEQNTSASKHYSNHNPNEHDQMFDQIVVEKVKFSECEDTDEHVMTQNSSQRNQVLAPLKTQHIANLQSNFSSKYENQNVDEEDTKVLSCSAHSLPSTKRVSPKKHRRSDKENTGAPTTLNVSKNFYTDVASSIHPQD